MDVKAIRRKVSMTQREFAMRLNVNLWSVRNWEQGRRPPTGAARTLLIIIDRDPDLFLRTTSRTEP